MDKIKPIKHKKCLCEKCNPPKQFLTRIVKYHIIWFESIIGSLGENDILIFLTKYSR